ncbi:VanZ family protein [Singulisphaera acidiphila]|uniref:Glycopeptide antibiotics resistance protein n=1 Tax=Singulisphaera acidiphila (strain ATCC BAA-1392 / DSM 18658 / VKM B-2454 / MOB10) TaxID=886293 RepID=L0DJC0_SINAD|nr:glycopeptide antibiotics resistance protein [Singulisphaera acidiphila DSM 18658]
MVVFIQDNCASSICASQWHRPGHLKSISFNAQFSNLPVFPRINTSQNPMKTHKNSEINKQQIMHNATKTDPCPQTGSSRRSIAIFFMIIYGIIVIFLTLVFFRHTKFQPANLVPFRTITQDIRSGGWSILVNLLGNIGLFLPAGFLLPLARRGTTSSWQVALFSVLASYEIETIQYISGRRMADVDDLLLNTSGGVLGYLLLRALQRLSGGRSVRNIRG